MESRPEDMVEAGDRLIDPKSLATDFMDGVDGLPDLVPVTLSETEDDIEGFLLMGISGCSKDTIFIPTDVPVDAGMNSVVTPNFLITVRCGLKGCAARTIRVASRV